MPTLKFHDLPTSPCSCYVKTKTTTDQDGTTTVTTQIVYCPLHSAARDMLMALQDIAGNTGPSEYPQARAVIEKATNTQGGT